MLMTRTFVDFSDMSWFCLGFKGGEREPLTEAPPPSTLGDGHIKVQLSKNLGGKAKVECSGNVLNTRSGLVLLLFLVFEFP